MSAQLILNLASALSERVNVAGDNQPKTLTVYGVSPHQSKVDIVDCVVKIAARVLYAAVECYCEDGKKSFLSCIKMHECELSIRIMDLLRQKNSVSSIEYIGFNNETNDVEVYFRKQASFSSQMAVAIPQVYLGVYLGPFESVCEVQQRQFALASRTSGKPVLATWHVADCVAVAGFDSNAGVGFLFHIDAASHLEGALEPLIGRYSFEYIVLGTSKLVTTVDKQFQKAGCTKRGMVPTAKVPEHELLADSYWSRAVRFSRSMAIDVRLKDPLAQILAYEPEINPFSALHNREKTLEEADRFCSKDGVMQQVSSFTGP